MLEFLFSSTHALSICELHGPGEGSSEHSSIPQQVYTMLNLLQLRSNLMLVEHLLHFLQGCAKSCANPRIGLDKIGPLNTHLRLNILANTYDIPTLRRYAADQVFAFVYSLTKFTQFLDCIPVVYQVLQPEATKVRHFLLCLQRAKGRDMGTRKRSLIDGL